MREATGRLRSRYGTRATAGDDIDDSGISHTGTVPRSINVSMDATHGDDDILDALSGFVDVAVELLTDVAAGRLGAAQRDALVHAVPYLNGLRQSFEHLVASDRPPEPPAAQPTRRGIQKEFVGDSPAERRRRMRGAGPSSRGLHAVGPEGARIEEDSGDEDLSMWLSGQVPADAGQKVQHAIDALEGRNNSEAPESGEAQTDETGEGDSGAYFQSMELERLCRPFREKRSLAPELPGSVTMQGTTASLPLSALLNFIVMNRSSGALRATSASEDMDLFFDNGNLVQVLSDNQNDPLVGEILVANRVIEARTLEEVISGLEPGALQVGAVLRGLELISAEELCDALEIQARTRFFRLYQLGDLEFSFHEGAYPPSDERLRLDVQGLLIEAAALTDDRAEVSRTI